MATLGTIFFWLNGAAMVAGILSAILDPDDDDGWGRR